MSIGARLREERERIGLTQPALGEAAAAAKRTVIDWEKGNSSPTAIQLEALALQGIDVQYVITGVRSREALSKDEVELLDRYRAASIEVKAAAIGGLIAGVSKQQKPARAGQVFHGAVGQSINVEGDLDQRGIRFAVKGSKKK